MPPTRASTDSSRPGRLCAKIFAISSSVSSAPFWTACRTAARGDGWVATEYLHRMRGCPSYPGDPGYTLDNYAYVFEDGVFLAALWNSLVIAVGETKTGSLTGEDPRLDEGEHYHAYDFDGRAGQRIAVSLRSSSFSRWPAPRRARPSVFPI